ncbi:MAG: FAD-binding oxidoreductase [Rhodobacteraceae bacterium]|nr:FAD-binding oxidoreductase [Paracoccaceae bacterium]
MMFNPAQIELFSGLPADLFCAAPAAYLEEPRKLFTRDAALLARPRNVEQVSRILAICNRNRVAVVPYCGGTGLVGGQVMQDGPAPLILSLERMSAVRDLDVAGNVMVVEAGAILADVQDAAVAVDRLFPLSLASEGSCRIGGNLATNAGGVQVLRYGNMRDLCLGLEVVLADGSVMQGLKRLRKDNTGYDLRNLMIGSEGTLGVITAATLKLFPRPREVTTAFLAVETPQAAVDLLSQMQDSLDGLVSAFELIHRTGLDFLKETMPQVRLPFDPVPEWMVLTEVGGGTGANIEARLMDVLEQAFEAGLASDALLAQNVAQRKAFWEVRESIPLANALIGGIASHDISVPTHRLPEFIAAGAVLIAGFGDLRLNCFGHLGDGNLHYNVYAPKGAVKQDFKNLATDVSRAIYDLVAAYDGSFSAEHGVGRLKTADLARYGDPVKLAAMRAVKTALDPQGVLNPGTVV